MTRTGRCDYKNGGNAPSRTLPPRSRAPSVATRCFLGRFVFQPSSKMAATATGASLRTRRAATGLGRPETELHPHWG
jgi:hypothetical protein